MVKIAVYCPKTFFRYQTVKDSISLFMRKKTAPEVKALFRQTVYGWSHKPRFQQKLTNRPDYMAMSVWASGDNANQYSLVNFGTQAHPIMPKSIPFLLNKSILICSSSSKSFTSLICAIAWFFKLIKSSFMFIILSNKKTSFSRRFR